MTIPGLARRRGISDLPPFPRSRSDGAFSYYYTPPASRTSDALIQERQSELAGEEVRWDEEESGVQRFRNLPADPFLPHHQDGTFFERDEDERVAALFHEQSIRRRHRSHRSKDDYAVDYSRFLEGNHFSPPQTPDDDAVSVEWDSSFDPFSSACFRRGSLVLDPAAFDSTPSVNYAAAPASPGGSAALKLKRSTEALKEFGKKVLPRLKIKSRESYQSEQSDTEIYKSHKTSPSTSSHPTSQSSSNRTRSNTLESSRSVKSKTSMSNMTSALPNQDTISREQLQDSSDVLSPLATYRSQHAPTTPVLNQEAFGGTSLWSSPKGLSTPPVASPSVSGTALSAVLEQSADLAPPVPSQLQKMSSLYNATDPGLEELMRQMQLDDDSFAEAEHNMIHSGWSTEHEINEIKKRRQEQQNLWQRRLDDALDHIKAQISID